MEKSYSLDHSLNLQLYLFYRFLHQFSNLRVLSSFFKALLNTFRENYWIQQDLTSLESLKTAIFWPEKGPINLSAASGSFEDQWRFFSSLFSKPSEPTELQNRELIENS